MILKSLLAVFEGRAPQMGGMTPLKMSTKNGGPIEPKRGTHWVGGGNPKPSLVVLPERVGGVA